MELLVSSAQSEKHLTVLQDPCFPLHFCLLRVVCACVFLTTPCLSAEIGVGDAVCDISVNIAAIACPVMQCRFLANPPANMCAVCG